ncbi:MAG: flagellar basal-body MS-ring/collar protein FliF [Hungatella sp.]
MDQVNKIKEFIGKMSGGMKKGLLIGLGSLIVFAVLIAVVLNTDNTQYATLFSGLTDQEASEVMVKLQEAAVDYNYQPGGNVMVPKELVDKTRATLAVEGFPKNGFAYETFLNNSNMMSTEADKKTLKIWDMQERLAATIRCMDGVKDAIVQIAPGETQKYVLDNSKLSVTTASVLVTMNDGGSPVPAQVEGIQRLVAKSVVNMDMGDVAVINGNGVDVSVKKNDGDTVTGDGKIALEQKEQLLVEANVLRVLEDMYGRHNVRVSAKCKADMQKTVSEENVYTAPNTKENSGYVDSQTLTSESSGGTGTGGIPGAQTNTNVPQYNTQPGATQNGGSSTSDTDYLLNQKKEQSQSDGGIITDISVAISINAADLGITKNDLISLVASAAGIDPAVQNEKIVVVNSEWPKNTVTDTAPEALPAVADKLTAQALLPMVIGGAVGLLILIILIAILIRKAKKKKEQLMDQDMLTYAQLSDNPAAIAELAKAKAKAKLPTLTAEDEQAKEMKENIRTFTEENPEISAQLLKTWLRGGEDHG